MKRGVLTFFSSRKVRGIRISMAIGMLALLLAGCGGSDDGATHDTADKKSGTIEKNINYTAAFLKKQSITAAQMTERLSTIDNALPHSRSAGSSVHKQDIVEDTNNANVDLDALSRNLAEILAYDFQTAAAQFDCGTATHNVSQTDGAVSVKFNFDGSCGASGSVTYVIEPGKGIGIEFKNFTTADCETNGAMTLMFLQDEASGQAAGVSLGYDKLSTCGEEELNVSIDITTDDIGNVIYKIGDAQYIYDVDGESVTATTDGIIVNENGETNGTISLQHGDGEGETLKLENLLINPKCGIPTSGSLIIDDSNGDPINIDFAQTTCDNPAVNFTVDGETQTVRLDIVADGTDSDNREEDTGPIDAEDGSGPDNKEDGTDSEVVDMSGSWQGKLKMGDKAPMELYFVNVHDEDGDSRTIELAGISIEFLDGVTAQLYDPEVSGSVDGSNVRFEAQFDQDLSDSNGAEVSYVFKGTFKEGMFSGDVSIGGVKESGSFELRSVEE